VKERERGEMEGGIYRGTDPVKGSTAGLYSQDTHLKLMALSTLLPKSITFLAIAGTSA
jgi:hypothetical protein